MAIRVHVHGTGNMGTAAARAVESAAELELCGHTGRADDLARTLQGSRPDVMVEFTVAEVMEQNLLAGLESGAHVVSGTTGFPDAVATQLGELAQSRNLGLLIAPNFCVGVLLMQRFARAATNWYEDVEIIEMHHDRKRDAPSGTALATAEQIADASDNPLNPNRPETTESLPGARGGRHREIPIHSVRLPGLLAHQEVIFGGPGQVLTIRHDTLDRQAFMPGVLLAINGIRDRKGLVDSLEHLLDLH